MSPVVEPNHGNKTRMIWAATVIVCVLVVASSVLFAIHQQNVSDQRALQAQLANPRSSNDTTVALASTQLINGKLSGKYTFSDKLLAQYYLQGATAYYNLKQYSKAAAYYQAAPKYDSTVQLAALQGEVSADYAASERQQLIPLLEKLETLVANIHSPAVPSSAAYQQDIWDIQHNQDAKNL